jgi:hypothetical protein
VRRATRGQWLAKHPRDDQRRSGRAERREVVERPRQMGGENACACKAVVWRCSTRPRTPRRRTSRVDVF